MLPVRGKPLPCTTGGSCFSSCRRLVLFYSDSLSSSSIKFWLDGSTNTTRGSDEQALTCWQEGELFGESAVTSRIFVITSTIPRTTIRNSLPLDVCYPVIHHPNIHLSTAICIFHCRGYWNMYNRNIFLKNIVSYPWISVSKERVSVLAVAACVKHISF
jgi:hypothetical protein